MPTVSRFGDCLTCEQFSFIAVGCIKHTFRGHPGQAAVSLFPGPQCLIITALEAPAIAKVFEDFDDRGRHLSIGAVDENEVTVRKFAPGQPGHAVDIDATLIAEKLVYTRE